MCIDRINDYSCGHSTNAGRDWCEDAFKRDKECSRDKSTGTKRIQCPSKSSRCMDDYKTPFGFTYTS